MRKQTKLVAVLSAAALLAMGASMTSFAAGWQKDDAGVWHYYDSDDEMVTDEWKKDGGKWFHLDEDGEMETSAWVDEYYVGEDGHMLTNEWVKTTAEDEEDDPDEDGDSWYYFDSKGKRVEGKDKKINGKTYFFDTDGKMQYGWYEKDGSVYYLGEEDDGSRKSGWLWLERPDEESDEDGEKAAATTLGEGADDEAWYWFGSDGKVYHNSNNKKKINGKYYYFSEQGQMLYEWINTRESVNEGTPDYILDDQNDGANETATASDMIYANQVEEGWRADGWYEIAGAADRDNDNDTDWYYFKKGEAKKASQTVDDAVRDSNRHIQYRKKIKINGKYFCFDQDGKMQTGLQRIGGKTYYFDENGYMKTGKMTVDDDDDNTFTFYFSTKNTDSGKGYDCIKDGYVYADGQRLEAEDDYAIYNFKGSKYVVNKTGKIQKSTKKAYELDGGEGYVTVNSDGTVKNYSSEKLDKITDYTVAFEDGDATVKVGGYNTKTKVYENGTYVRTDEDAPDGFIWEP